MNPDQGTILGDWLLTDHLIAEARHTAVLPHHNIATISSGSTSFTRATAPAATSSATRHASPGKGQDNGKRKGKQ